MFIDLPGRISVPGLRISNGSGSISEEFCSDHISNLEMKVDLRLRFLEIIATLPVSFVKSGGL